MSGVRGRTGSAIPNREFSGSFTNAEHMLTTPTVIILLFYFYFLLETKILECFAYYPLL
jgi:hypothetical protein